MSTSIDTPAVLAARLTGRRQAFLEHLIDGDGARTWAFRSADRATVMVDPAGRIAWDSTRLPGSVTAYDRAESNLGGAA